jgi:hypothetical protein
MRDAVPLHQVQAEREEYEKKVLALERSVDEVDRGALEAWGQQLQDRDELILALQTQLAEARMLAMEEKDEQHDQELQELQFELDEAQKALHNSITLEQVQGEREGYEEKLKEYKVYTHALSFPLIPHIYIHPHMHIHTHTHTHTQEEIEALKRNAEEEARGREAWGQQLQDRDELILTLETQLVEARTMTLEQLEGERVQHDQDLQDLQFELDEAQASEREERLLFERETHKLGIRVEKLERNEARLQEDLIRNRAQLEVSHQAQAQQQVEFQERFDIAVAELLKHSEETHMKQVKFALEKEEEKGAYLRGLVVDCSHMLATELGGELAGVAGSENEDYEASANRLASLCESAVEELYRLRSSERASAGERRDAALQAGVAEVAAMLARELGVPLTSLDEDENPLVQLHDVVHHAVGELARLRAMEASYQAGQDESTEHADELYGLQESMETLYAEHELETGTPLAALVRQEEQEREDSLTQALEAAEAEVDTLRSELEEAEERLAQAEEELGMERHKVEEGEAQLEAAREWKVLQAEEKAGEVVRMAGVTREHRAAIEGMEEERAAMEAEVARQKEAHAVTKQRLAAAKQASAELQDEIDELKEQLLTSVKELEASANRDLAVDNKALKEANAEVQDENKKLKERLLTSLKEVEALAKAKTDQVEKLTTLRGSSAGHKATVEALTKENGELRRQVVDREMMQSPNKLGNESLAELKYQRSRSENKELAGRVKELEKELAGRVKELTLFHPELELANAQAMKALEAANVDLLERVRDLDAEAAERERDRELMMARAALDGEDDEGRELRIRRQENALAQREHDVGGREQASLLKAGQLLKAAVDGVPGDLAEDFAEQAEALEHIRERLRAKEQELLAWQDRLRAAHEAAKDQMRKDSERVNKKIAELNSRAERLKLRESDQRDRIIAINQSSARGSAPPSVKAAKLTVATPTAATKASKELDAKITSNFHRSSKYSESAKMNALKMRSPSPLRSHPSSLGSPSPARAKESATSQSPSGRSKTRTLRSPSPARANGSALRSPSPARSNGNGMPQAGPESAKKSTRSPRTLRAQEIVRVSSPTILLESNSPTTTKESATPPPLPTSHQSPSNAKQMDSATPPLSLAKAEKIATPPKKSLLRSPSPVRAFPIRAKESDVRSPSPARESSVLQSPSPSKPAIDISARVGRSRSPAPRRTSLTLMERLAIQAAKPSPRKASPSPQRWQ